MIDMATRKPKQPQVRLPRKKRFTPGDLRRIASQVHVLSTSIGDLAERVESERLGEIGVDGAEKISRAQKLIQEFVLHVDFAIKRASISA